MSYFFDDATLAPVLYVRSGQRPVIHNAGLTIEALGARLADQQMEPFLIALAPHAEMGVVPHRWGNSGAQEARLLLVLQAATGAQEPARQHFADYPSVTHMG